MKKIIKNACFVGIAFAFLALGTPVWSEEGEAEVLVEQIEAIPREFPEVSLQPAVKKLKDLLAANPEWEKLLLASVTSAKVEGIESLEDYYNFLQRMLTWAPIEGPLFQKLLTFYWLIDQPAGKKLQQNQAFSRWILEFDDNLGDFLNTTASIKGIKTFSKVQDFHIAEAAKSPSGWMTFNQFFARHMKPGTRPIDGLCDDTIIVSPADSTPIVVDTISEDQKITAKGMTFSILELLKDSPYKDKFEGGTFMHSFLNVNDYHRYHVPVEGVVKEIKNIPGKAFLQVIRKEDGSLGAVDGTGYQFTQARGLIVLESPILGYVAVLPIGMAEVSSAVLTAEEGATLSKGEEFGYFQFGGSDIIVLFEKDKVEISLI